MKSNQNLIYKYKNFISVLITRSQKVKLILLFFILIIGMILEIFSLGVLVPLLSILLDKNTLESYQFYDILEPFISEYSYERFVVIFLGLIGFLYVLKALTMLVLIYYQNKILVDIGLETGNRLFAKYTNQKYLFHLNNNSSVLIKNIHVEVGIFKGICNSIISLIIELFLVLSIVITLLFINFKATIFSSSLLFVIVYVFFYFSNKKISELGFKREKYDVKFMNILTETFRGIKTFKIYSKETYLNKEFKTINNSRSLLSLKYDFLSQIPRYFLELTAVLGLIAFIAVSILNGIPSGEILVTLGLFVAAIFKILPSINKIINVVQSFKYSMPTIRLLFNEFNLPDYEPQDSTKLIFNDSITFKDISFYYLNPESLVLKNISLEIKKGQMIGFYGESGSGKSTLVNILSGILNPSSGDIFIDGVNIKNYYDQWKKRIGYVTQESYLLDKSILENISLVKNNTLIDKKKLSDSISISKLESFINSLPEGLNTMVGEIGSRISGGEMQRISLARALYFYKDILILDEFTSSLDVYTQKQLMSEMLKLKGDKTIIIIAHRLETLKECDVIYEVKKGKIIV